MAKLKLADIKVGGTYKIKNDQYAAHGYTKGEPVIVTFHQGSNIQIKLLHNPHSQPVNVYISHLDFYAQKKNVLEAQIAEAEALIADNKLKLKWMQDTNSEEFDEDEYKVWQVLSTIDDKKVTQIEKAKLIAALIKK